MDSISSIMIYRSDKDYAKRCAGQLKEVMEEYGMQVEMMEFHGEKLNQYEYYMEITRREPDLVFTLDFAGFSMYTDTEDIAYINLTCRNIHLIIKENDSDFEKYFTGKLSIAMLFYCRSHEIYCKLRNKYPDIPYLKEVSGWTDLVKDVLAEAL